MVNWLWSQSRNELTKEIVFTTLGCLPISYFSHENIPETLHEIDENEALLEISSGTFFQLVKSEKSPSNAKKYIFALFFVIFEMLMNQKCFKLVTMHVS